MHARPLQPCLTLCVPLDGSPPGSSVHGILQARILGWAAMPSSMGSSRPRDGTRGSGGSCTAGEFFTAESQGKPHCGFYWAINTSDGKLPLLLRAEMPEEIRLSIETGTT